MWFRKLFTKQGAPYLIAFLFIVLIAVAISMHNSGDEAPEAAPVETVE